MIRKSLALFLLGVAAGTAAYAQQDIKSAAKGMTRHRHLPGPLTATAAISAFRRRKSLVTILQSLVFATSAGSRSKR